ncbi:cationic amino acid transporter 4-like [Oppia nitens]|uniref:cationic amino acid transporter 4-like n=1 Tax=Oppia nitens TaxID=1686743 RepID=UPI0023D9DA0A|nr:cationic amino acid transporter 4-like [Oppia nitens]
MVDTFSTVLKILLRRKTNSSPVGGKPIPQKSLSVVDITCLGLSTTIGTGVYTILAHTAREYSGPSIVLSFLIASVASGLAGLAYSELCTRFPSGGSAYCYVYSILGELPAFLIGWSLVFEYFLAVILSTKSITNYMNYLLNDTFANSFTYNVFNDSNGGIFFDIPSALLLLLIGYVLTQNLKNSCIYNNILVFICLLITVGILLSCLSLADCDNWTAGPGFFPNGIVGIFSGAAVCLFVFNGYDIIGLLSSECRHSYQNTTSAISLTFVLSLMTSFSLSIAITLLVPFSLLETNASLIKIFVTRGLNGMKYFVIMGAICGLISSTIASLLSLSRLLYCLSNDGLLFTFLSKYESNSGVAKCATIVSTVVCAITCIPLQTTTILNFIGTGTIFAYMTVTLSILSLRYCRTENLPSDSCEMLLRENSYIDIRENSLHNITQSISDYYLNKRQTILKSIANDSQLIEELPNDNCLSETFCNCIQSDRPLNCSHHHSYGSLPTARTLSVELINQTVITSVSNLSLTTRQEPTVKSEKFVLVILPIMMATMFIMAITTVHMPNLLPVGIQWSLQLFSTLLFIVICVCVALMTGQPRHHVSTSNNSMPCIPLLPICSIWLDIHLIVCLPYTSWLAFLIWCLFGIFVYMSFGVWNSVQALDGLQPLDSIECLETIDGDDCNAHEDYQYINELALIETSDESQEFNICDIIVGSSV